VVKWITDLEAKTTHENILTSSGVEKNEATLLYFLPSFFSCFFLVCLLAFQDFCFVVFYQGNSKQKVLWLV